MCAFLVFVYNIAQQIMENDKPKDVVYITPEIDELVKEVIETEDDEEADLITEILKEK